MLCLNKHNIAHYPHNSFFTTLTYMSATHDLLMYADSNSDYPSSSFASQNKWGFFSLVAKKLTKYVLSFNMKFYLIFFSLTMYVLLNKLKQFVLLFMLKDISSCSLRGPVIRLLICCAVFYCINSFAIQKVMLFV